jgi:asparagine synthase (glutamine-hydrolysing)
VSGICGIVALDGSAPTAADIDSLARPLAQRGPDGTHLWRDGAAALGHALLATTPEALVETLPLVDGPSGCTITADVRLDNRDELIAALDLVGLRTIGDGELILRAYLRWGDACPQHLLGDFAFAIWDARRQRLFCARDHMGMRQLTYCHLPRRAFLFATEPAVLGQHHLVPGDLDEARIADYLADLEAADLSSTFYRHVRRLPPAFSLTVDRAGVTVRRYWQLGPQPELRLDSDDDYAAAFLAVFTQAVQCRLRAPGAVGAMLSGGIDSNAVAAVAARLLGQTGAGPLLTFSAVDPDNGDCAETRAIRAAAANPGFAPVEVAIGDMATLGDELIRRAGECAEPFDGHMTLSRAVYLAAHRRGVNIMLDGGAGDVALSAGNRIAALLRAGKIAAAIAEARAERRFWGPAVRPARRLLAAAWAAFAPDSLRAARRRLATRRAAGRATSGTARIAPAFAKQIDLAARVREVEAQAGPHGPLDPRYRAQLLVHPNLVVGRERYDRVAAAFAIEARDPFMDLRLLRFCLSLPSAQLQRGWPKYVLRRAMHGLVPDAVTWRRGKEHLGWAFTKALIAKWQASDPGWPADDPRLDPYVSRSAQLSLSRARDRGLAKDVDRQCGYALGVLSRWIRRQV